MSEYVHTFKAPTLDEAYRKMRKQLGEEAIVLRAAESYEGGVLGFMRRRVFTVTAALPPKAAAARGARVASAAEKKYAVQSPSPKTSPAAAPIETAGVIGTDATIKDTVAYFQKVVAEAQRRTQVAEETKHVRAPLPPHSERISSGNVAERDQSPIVPFRKPEIAQADMHKEIAEMHDMLSGLIADRTASGFSDETGPVFRGLLEAGCERTMCAAILGTAVKGLEPRMAKDPRVVRERVRIEMRKRIWVNEGIKLIPGRCTVVAVVGVTGVGKTTNLAKLAAYFSVHERARVALITADTYRVAAPEQLRVYANIIGLPMTIVHDADEMAAAIDAHSNYDLVLIDTAGSSQFNLRQIEELRLILRSAAPQDTMLMLAANTQLEELRSSIEAFESIRPTSVFFTKLDETQRYGVMFSVLADLKLPASYVSFGQNVPDDFMLADQGKLADLILKGREDHGRSSTKSA